jgi:hypothetical protein
LDELDFKDLLQELALEVHKDPLDPQDSRVQQVELDPQVKLDRRVKLDLLE